MKEFYYSYVQSCSLCEGRTSFCRGLNPRKLSGFLLMFSTGFTSLCLTSFSSIDHILHFYPRYLILFHLTQMRFSGSNHLPFLSLETLTFIKRTGQPILVELVDLVNSYNFYIHSYKYSYNFSISNDLTQMVNSPTHIPDCDSHSPSLLDLFLSPDASICCTMAFPPLGNSDHVVVSVPFTFQ